MENAIKLSYPPTTAYTGMGNGANIFILLDDGGWYNYQFTTNIDGVYFGFLKFPTLNASWVTVENRPVYMAVSSSPFILTYARKYGNTVNYYDYYEVTSSYDIISGVSCYYARSPFCGGSEERLYSNYILSESFTGFSVTSEEQLVKLLPYNISYRLTNCSAPDAPQSANIGDTVNVNFTFPEGFGIVNSSDVYVTNNGVVVPSSYANGRLTFTMPDPS